MPGAEAVAPTATQRDAIPARPALERRALRSALVAFIVSRAVVCAAGAIAVLVKGTERSDGDIGPLNQSFGRVGELLTASTARFDSGFYLTIVLHGYGDDKARPAFAPLYPLLTWILKPLAEPFAPTELTAALLAGIVVSCAAFIAGLYLLHRLTALDFGTAAADRVVVLTAFFPVSFYFSAVYTESLFLALSVGAVYAARRDRWALAGGAGALAAATRPPGALLLIPLALILLYSPRHRLSRRDWAGWRPRLAAVSGHALWLALLPAAVLAVSAYFWHVNGDPMAMSTAQREMWGRHLVTPPQGLVEGGIDGAWALNQVRKGSSPISDMPTRAPLSDLAFAAFTAVALVGAVRRLPAAYWTYAIAAVLLVLSLPPADGHEHLLSLPRFVAVLFPVLIWLGLWTADRRRYLAALGASATLLAGYTALFATGHWVA